MKNLHRDRCPKDISRKREREGKEKSKRRDLSNRSLKTDGKTDNRKPMYGSFERDKRERQEKSKSRNLCKRSLKTDGETDSREPT